MNRVTRRRPHPSPTAFTLIEVLVVIAVIALLISIFLPALRKGREAGRSVVCLSNQRSIGMALSMYASTYKDWIPRESGFADHTPWGGLPARALVPGYPGSQYNISWAFHLRPFLDPRANSSSPNGVLGDKFKDAPYYRDPARPRDPHNIHYVNNGLFFNRVNGVVSVVEVGKQPNRLLRCLRPSETLYLTCFTDDPNGLRWGDWYTHIDEEVAIYYDMWAASNVTGIGAFDHRTAQRIAVKRHSNGANAVFLDGHAKWVRGHVLTDILTWDDGDYRRE
jgi:prepilin-type processing-associated H-X9-DG protein/prepilin-type N-terminal cleavage/methylation domain-containing protein